MKRLVIFTLMLALCCAVQPGARADEPGLLLSFDGGTAWLNSKPLSLGDVRNKAVLVDFWNYTDISSLRMLPYLKEWYKRYSPYGFEIVSIQSPDVAFEGQTKDVEAAVEHYGVTWPVVIDANHAIADRYGLRYYPHLLLFDHNGFRILSIAHETDYPEIESVIRLLMGATHPEQPFGPVMPLLPQDSYLKPNALKYPVTPPIDMTSRSFIGNEQENPFGSGTDYTDVKPPHKDGVVYLQGPWRKLHNSIVSFSDNGYAALHYHAIEVQALMYHERGGSATVLVTQNGQPVAKEDAGADIKYDAQGQSYVLVDMARSYDLIMNKRWGTYDLRLYPKAADVGIYHIEFETAETGSDY